MTDATRPQMTHYYPRCVGARHPKCDRRPILSQVLVRRARQPRQHSPRAQANPARASWRARCDTRGLGDLIEAMAPAGGLLTLSAYVNEETEAHTVVVGIADSGPGIAPEQLERIWEAFYTTKTEGRGSGFPSCERWSPSSRARRSASEARWVWGRCSA